jgi:hypothetical protein
MIQSAASVDELVDHLARLFAVGSQEVAIMRLQGHFLRFIAPAELTGAGSIPLNSAAIAARTATSGKDEIFNNFSTIRHASIFETVRLANQQPANNHASRLIQKLMSVPLIDERGVLIGVVQISRKGATHQACGPDFSLADLTRLRGFSNMIAQKVRELSPRP